MELWQTKNQLKDSSCSSIVGNSFPQAKETDVRNSHHQGSNFFFQYKGKNQCVDATDEVAGESHRGSLVNHGKGKEANARVQVLSIDNTPRLRFFSTRNIKVGEEILYDYGTMKLTWEINMQSGTTSNKDKESASTSDHKGLNLERASDIEDSEEKMSFRSENTGAVPNMDKHSASTICHQTLNPERASDVEDSEEEIPFLSRPQNSGAASKKDKASPSTSSHQSLNPDRAGDEEEPDEEIPFVFCPQVQKKSGKRVYNKHQACYYCGKLVTKISKHLLQVHSDEPRVAQISALPPKSNSRVVELELIRNRGNYHHNLEVISKQRGQLILVRRPSLEEEFNIDDYGPCPYCLGFYKTYDLYKHCKYFCVAGSIKDPAKDTKDIRLASDTLIGKYNGVTPYLQKAFRSMQNDELGMIARNDPLILERENSHRRKGSGMDSHKCRQYVSQEMHQSARMLKEMRELEKGGDRYKMEDFLTPGRSDLVAEAVLNVASSSEKQDEEAEDEAIGEPDDDTFDAADDIANPSVAIKNGHHLGKLAEIKRCHAIRNFKEPGVRLKEKEANRFLDQKKTEWAEEENSHSIWLLSQGKFDKADEMPDMCDIANFAKFLIKEIEVAVKHLEDAPSPESYIRCEDLVLSRLCTFNKCCVGEVEVLKLTSYTCRPNWDEACIQEVRQHLSSLECQLTETLGLVFTGGKRGKKLPIIITADCKKAMDCLVSNRQAVGIQNNCYFFAIPGHETYMRACDSLRDLSKEANLKKPQLLRTTKIRKYVSTISQILDLQGGQLEWLANHLGHSVQIHGEYYRLTEPTLELAKVAKLMIAIDQGKLSRFAGKSVDDIELEDINSEQEDADDATDIHHLACKEDREEEPTVSDTQTMRSQQKRTSNNSPGSPRKRQRYMTEHLKDSYYCPSDSSDSYGDEPSRHSAIRKKHQKQAGCRRTWSRNETEAVWSHFNKFIKSETVPGRDECVKCLNKSKVLESRSWKDVKYKVKNIITAIKRQRGNAKKKTSK